MADASSRQKPNILITGTTGTGKSTMVEALIAQVPTLRAVDIGALVKDKQLHTGWDEEYQSYILDEDRLLDELEDELEPGGAVVEYHGADLFPERWYDLVLVLRADTNVLYGRLESRGYPQKKLSDNVEAEIMQVILDEAREAYREEIVIELPSNTIEDIESNVARTVAWLQAWRPSSN
jgi:adenylate kinase